MGDAFRGLTIRLGADQRPLVHAINSISSSARAAQKQLTAMNKALKFNPTNVAAMGARLDLIGDKAQLAARSVVSIKTAMQQTSAETKELAGKTKDIYAATQKARSAYNHVNAELQRIYDGAARVYASQLKSNDATLKQADAMKLAVEHVNELRRAYNSAGEEAKELDSLVRKANSRGLGKLFDTKGRPERLIEIMRSLRGEHSKLAGQISRLNKAEGYRAMETQLIAWRSELRQAAVEAARFRSEFHSLNAAPGVAKQTEALKRMDAALDEATASARKLDAAFQKHPGDITLATQKLRAEANVEEIINDKLKARKAIMNSLGSKIDKQAAETRNIAKWVSEAEHKWARYSQAVNLASEKVDKLDAEMKEAFMVGAKGTRPLEAIQADLEKARAKLEKLKTSAAKADDELKKANAHRSYKQAADDVRVLEAELRQATSMAAGLRRALDFSKTIRTMGYGLYSTLTPAITIAGRYAIQSARDIDAAYRDMRKTVNGTEEQFEHLRDAALEFSTTHFTDARKILEIEAMGGQLGIAATDLEAFSETVSNLDVATNIDADTVAEQLGKMSTVLGIDKEQFDNFGDALVRLGNNMPVMESDIMTLMTRFMGMGKVVGMSADEMLAWSAAASATGQKSEAAGSSMQRFISNMETAVVGGGETLEKWAGIAGMGAEEFADAFRKDASSAMYAFIDGLGQMQRRGDSVNQALKDLKINNVRDKQLLEGLAVQMANAGDGASVLGEALRMAHDAYNGMSTKMADGTVELAGDAAREAGKKAEGFSGQVQMMINTAQLLSSELAAGAIPYVKALGDMFRGATEALKAMPDSAKTAIVGVLGIAAAIGPVAVGVGALGAAIETVMDVALKATAARTLATAAKGGGMLERALKQIGTVSPKAASGLETVALMAMEAAPAFIALAPAIIAAAATIGFLVTDISRAAKDADNFNKSVSGYADEIKRSLPDLESSVGGFDKLSTSVKHAGVNLDELARNQAEARKNIVERNRTAQDEIAALSAAKTTIDKYLNQSLDPSQQAEFRAAVALVNEECRTQLQVVDAANGKIRDEKNALMETSAAIDEYINKKRLQIQQEALLADYQDAHAAERESYKAMVSQLALVNDYREKARNADNAADKEYWDNLADNAYDYYEKAYALHEQAKEGEEAVTKAMAATEEAANGGAKSLDALIHSTESWSDAFKAIYGDADWASGLNEFVAALNEAGVKQEQLAELSDEEIAKVVDAYSRTGDIKAALDSVGISVTSLMESTRSSFEQVGINFDELANQIGVGAEDLAQKLYTAGISAQDVAAMMNDGIDFGQLFAEAEGNIDVFIAKIQEINNQRANPQVEVTGDEEAAQATGELADNLENLPDGEVDIEDESVGYATENVENLGQEVEGLPPSKDIDVNVTGNAQGALQDIITKLGSIQSKDVYITTHEKKVQDAAGGFFALHATGGHFRLHGSGGFVTSGPTILGTDPHGYIHIAGEAGREWIKRHADGTTSILPIENRRYLKPYAREIAGMIQAPSYDDSYLIAEIRSLNDAITSMQLVLDGKTVGKVMAPEMNRQLKRLETANAR